jgi:hypothetical protein
LGKVLKKSSTINVGLFKNLNKIKCGAIKRAEYGY